MNKIKDEHWDLIIKPEEKLFSFKFKELWAYKDLLLLMVKKEVTTVYKQTILGPIWFFIQPILTTVIFTLVFGQIAHLSTDGVPQILFYLSGLIVWNFFADTLIATSKTFTENAAIFGKVYFPRLIMPLSKVISGLLKFVIQLILFLGVGAYYVIKGYDITLNTSLLLFPLLLLLMVGLGLGAGIILSSLTTKYRDLVFLISFGVQLMMYATPVIIPLSSVPVKYQWIMELNPMTFVIETFRYVFLNSGMLDWMQGLYSFSFMILLLFIGILIFNKVERNFIDTV